MKKNAFFLICKFGGGGLLVKKSTLIFFVPDAENPGLLFLNGGSTAYHFVGWYLVCVVPAACVAAEQCIQ